MTLVMGFVWGKGVVMVSDSRATVGLATEEERKLYPIFLEVEGVEHDLAVVGGAGSASLVKQCFRIVERHFKGFFLSSRRYPETDDVDSIVDAIQGELVQRFSELRSHGVGVDVELMLGMVTAEGEPRLYVYERSGLYEPRHKSPGYAMIGIGRDTGGLLLMSLLGYDAMRASSWDMSIFTAFIVDAISAVNPYVSPLSSFLDSIYIRWSEEDGGPVLGPLRMEAFIEAKQRSSKRLSVYRELWDLMERVGEDVVREALESLRRRDDRK